MPARSPTLSTLLALACLVAGAAGPAGAAPARRSRATFEALHGVEPARVHRVDDRAEVRLNDPAVTLPPTFLPALRQALDELEPVFGHPGDPIRIQVAGESRSMAVAYNPREDAVIFPRNPKARNHGLEDLDRLRHELFHAYVGRTYPALVTEEALKSEELRTIHEGAADFFAWLGDDNQTFGDRFKDDQGPLRRYRTAMRFSMVQGSHALGNTLTSYWIQRGTSLDDLADDLKAGCQQVACLVDEEDHQAFGLDPATRPEVSVGVEGAPPSALGRYRVEAGDVLRLAGNPALAAAFPDLETRFTTRAGQPVPGWRFRPLDQDPRARRFSIEPEPGAKPVKIIVRHLAGGEVVGFDVLYLSAR